MIYRTISANYAGCFYSNLWSPYLYSEVNNSSTITVDVRIDDLFIKRFDIISILWFQLVMKHEVVVMINGIEKMIVFVLELPNTTNHDQENKCWLLVLFFWFLKLLYFIVCSLWCRLYRRFLLYMFIRIVALLLQFNYLNLWKNYLFHIRLMSLLVCILLMLKKSVSGLLLTSIYYLPS